MSSPWTRCSIDYIRKYLPVSASVVYRYMVQLDSALNAAAAAAAAAASPRQRVQLMLYEMQLIHAADAARQQPQYCTLVTTQRLD